MSTSIPYSKRFPELESPMGESTVHTLRYPYRGTLHRVIMAQASGEPAIAVLQLFTSLVGAQANDPLDKICELSSNEAGVIWEENLNINYMNREGTPSNGVRRLYARITPDVTDSETSLSGEPNVYALDLTMEPPVF